LSGTPASAAAVDSGAGCTSGEVRRGLALAAGLGEGTATGAGGGGNSVIVAVSGVDSGDVATSSGHSVNATWATSDSTSATASARRVRVVAFDCAKRRQADRSVGAAAAVDTGLV
jgi:hypothetical protein